MRELLVLCDAPLSNKAEAYLDETLKGVGIKEKFVTCQYVHERPKLDSGKKLTKREMVEIAPRVRKNLRRFKFVLILGNVPLQAITGEVGIKKKRGKPFEKGGVVYLPAYQPSYIFHGEYVDEPVFRQDVELMKTILEGGGIPQEKELNTREVETERDFELMLKDLRGTVSFDIETTGLYPWAEYRPDELPKKWKKDPPDPRSYEAKLTSLGFGTRKYQWIMVQDRFQLTRARAERITKRLEDCIVVGHYSKFDKLWMMVQYGVDWPVDFDTGIAHYMIDENSRHGLKDLATRFCNAPNWDVDKQTKQTFSNRAQGVKYHAHDLYYTRKLKFILHKKLEEDPQVHRVFTHIMMPLLGVFTEAEFEGPFIDLSKMDEVEKQLKDRIAAAEKLLSKWGDINWASPKQLADLLFNKLDLEVISVGKPGKGWPDGVPSTSESVLKQLDHPCVKDLLDFRGAKQQLSFFIDGWKPYLDGARLHPSFKLTGTVTGRLSCEHPNLQQVPRDPFIRSLIVAPPGWVLVEADLSQIELRIAAELAGERALIDAFLTGKDPHWMTALNELRRGRGEKERVLKTAWKLSKRRIKDYDDAIDILWQAGADACVAVDYAWKELRKKAKAINFGYLYGMGWKKFKQYARDKYDVILTDKQAKTSRETFFALYKDLPRWHKRQRKYAQRNGYVRTLSGRKRRLPAAMTFEDTPERGEAERQAINSPVQSFANELNLMAIIQLTKEFSRDVYRPIATVHDSILAYVRKDWVERVCKRTSEVMCHPELMDTLKIELEIPIESEITIGPWGAGKKWHAPKNTERRSPRSIAGERARTRTISGTSRNSRDASRRDRSRQAA